MPKVTPNTITVTMDHGTSFEIEKGSVDHKHLLKALEDAKDREFAEHRTKANNLMNGTMKKEVMEHLNDQELEGLVGQTYIVKFGPHGNSVVIVSSELIPSDRVTIKPVRGAKKP